MSIGFHSLSNTIKILTTLRTVRTKNVLAISNCYKVITNQCFFPFRFFGYLFSQLCCVQKYQQQTRTVVWVCVCPRMPAFALYPGWTQCPDFLGFDVFHFFLRYRLGGPPQVRRSPCPVYIQTCTGGNNNNDKCRCVLAAVLPSQLWWGLISGKRRRSKNRYETMTKGRLNYKSDTT